MGSTVVIIGAGILCFLLIYLSFKLEEEHFILKLLLLLFVVGGVVMIGKAVLDEQNYCEYNLVNSTVTGSTTVFGYEFQCEDNTNTTALTFYKGTIWFFRLFFTYIFGYFVYRVLLFLNWVVPGDKKGDDGH